MNQNDTKLINLPDGWKWVKLGEVCEKVESVKRSLKPSYENLFYLDIGGIDNQTNKIVSHKEYTWENAPSRAQQIVFKNDTLFSTVRTYLKNIALIENSIYHKQIASSGFTVIRGKKDLLHHKFIFYYAISQNFLQPLNELQTGSSYPAVRDKDVFNQLIPLPPLSIQAQIVEKLEAVLSELDKGKAQLLTAQAQLKTYRQAVLKYAFEGKLTGGTEGWEWVKIGDIADVGTGVTPLRTNKSFWENGTIPWITSGALNDDNVKESKEFITETALKETSLKIYPKHTLLIALYGEGKTRGKCSELLFESTTNQAIAGIKLKAELSESRKFLKLFLLKKYQDLRTLASGGVQPNLNLSLIKNTELPFPPLSTQEKIVTEIESRLSVCDKLEETIKASLAQCETLRQSVLKRAFEGRLV